MFICTFYLYMGSVERVNTHTQKKKQIVIHTHIQHIILENEFFFELKSKGYRDGIKRKETR